MHKRTFPHAHQVTVVLALTICTATVLSAASRAETVLHLETVQAAVRKNHPALQAARHTTESLEALQRHAAPFPNPELETEVENVLGNGPYEGGDLAELTFLVGQPILLGGKQGIRRRQADLQTRMARLDETSTERALLAMATKAFYSALAAQEHIALSKDMVAFSEELLKDTHRRVQAGQASEMESSKAGIALSESKLELAGAEQAYRAAMERLALICGKPFTPLPTLSGQLGGLPALAGLDRLEQRLREHPAWKRWDDIQAKARAGIEEADAERVPDVVVGAGVRYDRAEAAHAFLFQAAVPLPLWNRNRGPREAARRAAHSAEAEAEAARRELRLLLNEAYTDLSVAYLQARTIEQELLPAAKKAHDLSRAGYQSGRFGFLDVLEARSKLFEHHRRHIEILAQCRHNLAELAYLVGPDLPPLHQDKPAATESSR